MKNYNIRKMSNTRYFVEFKEKNKLNETLTIEVTRCTYDNKSSNSLPKIWLKNGYTNHLYNTAIHIDTYCTLENADCVSKYNPTCKLSEDKNRMVINFDNLLEVSEENEKLLIDKIYNLFMESEF